MLCRRLLRGAIEVSKLWFCSIPIHNKDSIKEFVICFFYLSVRINAKRHFGQKE